MGAGISVALWALGLSSQEGCSGDSSNGGYGSGNNSRGPSAPVATANQLKMNPTSVRSALMSRGYTGVSNSTGFNNPWTGARYGYIHQGCGYDSYVDQYICVNTAASDTTFANLNLKGGGYTINQVVMHEDDVDVTHYSPLRIVQQYANQQPRRGWYPSSNNDQYYDDYSSPAPTPSRSDWGNSSPAPEEGDNEPAPSRSNWSNGSNRSPAPEEYDNDPAPSGLGNSNSPSPAPEEYDNDPAPSNSNWSNSGTSAAPEEEGSVLGAAEGFMSLLSSPAQAYGGGTFIYQNNYYQVGGAQYIVSPYSETTLITMGYAKDWIDWAMDYNIVNSNMTVYYTKDNAPTTPLAVNTNVPLFNSPATNWLCGRGNSSGNCADIETLSAIIQGTYVEPLPPAPVPTPAPTTQPTPAPEEGDNEPAAAAKPVAPVVQPVVPAPQAKPTTVQHQK